MRFGWDEFAACRNDPHPEDWFEGAGSSTRRERTLRVCFDCPVRNECLEEALRVERHLETPIGTAGGLTAPQRKRLLEETAA